jgi:hypothetical protein
MIKQITARQLAYLLSIKVGDARKKMINVFRGRRKRYNSVEFK